MSFGVIVVTIHCAIRIQKPHKDRKATIPDCLFCLARLNALVADTQCLVNSLHSIRIESKTVSEPSKMTSPLEMRKRKPHKTPARYKPSTSSPILRETLDEFFHLHFVQKLALIRFRPMLVSAGTDEFLSSLYEPMIISVFLALSASKSRILAISVSSHVFLRTSVCLNVC